jgi:tryptophanyl-tRNA synthetase
MQTVITGVQPSGALHLGNYLGAVKPALARQGQGFTIYFIADYHALTSLPDPVELRARVHDIAAAFLACGLDPKRSIFFRQSDVSEVQELAGLLANVTPFGLLKRAHSIKDREAKNLPINQGIFAYPVLMAADILLYRATHVPVGKDQIQHLEIARELASKFNQRYGEVFVVPEAVVGEAAIVPGLDGEKMSKSKGNTIPLFSSAAALKKLVMGIPTDSTPLDRPKPIAGTVLDQIMEAVSTPSEYAAFIEAAAKPGVGYGYLKGMLLAGIEQHIAPLRDSFTRHNPEEIKAILKDGAERARVIAGQVLGDARQAMGLN